MHHAKTLKLISLISQHRPTTHKSAAFLGSFLSNLCNKSSWKCELDLGKGKRHYQKAKSEDVIYESRYHNMEADDRARIEI